MLVESKDPLRGKTHIVWSAIAAVVILGGVGWILARILFPLSFDY